MNCSFLLNPTLKEEGLITNPSPLINLPCTCTSPPIPEDTLDTVREHRNKNLKNFRNLRRSSQNLKSFSLFLRILFYSQGA